MPILLLAACASPEAPAPAKGCDDRPARLPGGDAPLVPALKGAWEEVLGHLLALLDDAPAGPAQVQPHAFGDGSTWSVKTQAGAEAWVSYTDAGAFAGFGYSRDGHTLPFEMQAMQARLEDVVDGLQVAGLQVTVQTTYPHNSFGDSEGVEAKAGMHLQGMPVVRYAPERFLGDPPEAVVVSQEWFTYGTPLRSDQSSVRVGALVRLPQAQDLMQAEAAAPLAAFAVQCALLGTATGLPAEVRAFVKDDAIYHHEGSLGWAVSVDYGDWCPDEAINHGRQWDAWVLVDARTGAILHTGPGYWNCIGVPSPMEAAGSKTA